MIDKHDAGKNENPTATSATHTWHRSGLHNKEGINCHLSRDDHLGMPQKITSINGANAWSTTDEVPGKGKKGQEMDTEFLLDLVFITKIK